MIRIDALAAAIIASQIQTANPHLPPHITQEYANFTIAAADRWKVSPFLLAALIECESHWRKRAKSEKGAIGLCQIMPATKDHIERQRDIYVRDSDLYFPFINIDLGAYWLSKCLKETYSTRAALQLYNTGSTQKGAGFANKVIRVWKKLKGHQK